MTAINEQLKRQIPVVINLPSDDRMSAEIANLQELARDLKTLVASIEKLGVKLTYSEEEAADAIGIKKRTLQEMRLAGKVPFKYVGRKPVYTRAHLEKFLASGS
jgi:hypothetical protein